MKSKAELNREYAKKFKEYLERNKEEHLFDTIEEIDLEVVSDLYEEGAPLNSENGAGILGALARHYQFDREKEPRSEEVTNAYINQIKKELNKHLKKKRRRDPKKCDKALDRLINSSKNKFKDYLKHHPMGVYRQGAIALALLMAGYPPETVAQALLRNKAMGLNSRAEVDKILTQCSEVMGRYDLIDEAASKPDFLNINTPGDFYRAYTKDYIRSTDTSTLNYRDDLHLASGMYDHLVTFFKKENNIQENDNPLLKRYIDEQIKPTIFKSIKEGSPVAREYGRDTDEYAKSLVEEAEIVVRKSIELEGQKEEEIAQVFQRLKERFAEKARQQKEENQLFQEDSTLAKEMLGLYIPKQKVLDAISRNSNFLSRHEQDEEAAGEYIKSVMDAADKAIEREEGIHFYKKQPIEGKTMKDLVAAGISVGMLYQQGMLSFAEASPVNIIHLSEEGTDYNIACKLINDYPDINTRELGEAINEYSPRKALIRADESYGRDLTRRAVDDLRQANEISSRRQLLKEEFEKTQGFIREGVYRDQDPILANQYGKMAMRAVQRNFPEELFRNSMIEKAQEDQERGNELGASPKAFVNTIITQAKEVIERNRILQEQEISRENEASLSQEEKAKQQYIEMAKKQLSKKSFVDRATDINFAQNMLAAGVPISTITNTLSDYSPVYKEPGHTTEGYLIDIVDQAREKLDKIKEDFYAEQIFPRDDFASVSEEFQYHQEKLKQKYNLPYTEAFDQKIADGLLRNGISGDLLAPALQEHSPLARQNSGYGISLIEQCIDKLVSGGFIPKIVNEMTKTEHERTEVKTNPDNSLIKTRIKTMSTTYTYEDKPDE